MYRARYRWSHTNKCYPSSFVLIPMQENMSRGFGFVIMHVSTFGLFRTYDSTLRG
jgi:hypothetical protein